MSEIASKANSRPSSGLAQPLVKKGGDQAHEMLFAALFGGVVAVETDADLMAGGLAPVNTDTDTEANSDGNPDILAAMQVVAAMLSGHRSTDRNSGAGADAASPAGAGSAGEDDQVVLDGEPAENRTPDNPMMIGPMPLQQQAGTSLPSAETSAAMAHMTLEDDVVMLRQNKSRAVLKNLIYASRQSGFRSQMATLSSSSSLQSMKLAEKPQSNADLIDDMVNSELDIDTSQIRLAGRPDGRLVIRTASHQQNISQASLASSKSAKDSDQAQIDVDGDMLFDSADDFMRAVGAQRERGVGGTKGQSVSGDSLSANAVRQMQGGGLPVGGQMSQQNNGQSGGQSGGQSSSLNSASSGLTNGSMMDVLDMAQDNWTEMLLQRVEKGLAGGKDKIDFHLNPRNLGRMRISLVVQNERTNVHIQTETTAAAHLLTDAEARLAQMMDASGLKFGNLTSQYNQNFGGNFAGQNSGQGREGGAANAMASDTSDGKDEANTEINVEQTENLINLRA